MPDEPTPPAPPPVDLATVAARLALRPAEVYREIKAGALKSTAADGRTRFAEADIRAFEEKRDAARSDLAEEVATWRRGLAPPAEDAPAPDGKADPGAQAKELAELLLRHAFAAGAQGVHLDPVENGVRVLCRTDSGLDERGRLSPRLGDLVRQALKAKLGKPDPVAQPVVALARMEHEGRGIQIQGTLATTLLGEHVHLRFRDPQKEDALEDLGYSPGQAEALRELLDGRAGVLLVAGAADPFSARHRLGLADRIAAGNRLVVSLEHRVHFKSEILVQLALPGDDEAAFAPVLAAALAMSPDVLLLDDVRNATEARGLFEAVAAGVTVIAQLRSPGNAEALLRMVEFGIGKDVLARDLLGMVARRSLRRVCPSCAGRRAPTDEEATALRAGPGASLAVPVGCGECGDGFRDRRVLQDLWANTPQVAALVRAVEPPAQELRAWARTLEHGIADAARAAVLAGEIAFADVASLLAE